MTPSINFETGALTQEGLRDYFSQLSEYQRKSIQLLSNQGYGIVDTSDPSIRATDAQKPLWITEVSKTSYTVLSGSCVTPSGEVCVLDTDATLNLVDLSGSMNLFVMKYEVIDSTITALTASNKMVPVGTVPSTTLVCMQESKYLGLDAETRNNCVVIGGVVYSELQDNTLYLEPTLSRPWMRSWFSMSDITHRSKIGSGEVSDTNVHGIGLGDLRVGGMSIYDQLTSSGMVLSKDTSISGVPGYYCQDTIVASSVKTDLTGAVTSASFFGGANTFYVELSSIPNVLCCAYEATTRRPIGVDHIVGTRIVVLYTRTQVTSDLVFGYTKTPTLMLNNTSSQANALEFAGISNKEIVISNGSVVKRLVQGTYGIRKYASIPRNFKVFADDNGFLIGDPGVLAQATNITDNTNKNLLAVPFVPKIPMFVGVGAHGIGDTASFTMTVVVTGILESGDINSEELIFNNSTYEDMALPPAIRENDKQVLFTSNSYTEIVSVMVETAFHNFQGIQSTATVVVYGKLDSSKHRYCALASGFWNGREATNLRDIRRVLPVVRDGIYGVTAITSTAEVLVGANEIVSSASSQVQYKRVTLVCAEDFREPRFLDSSSVLWEGGEILDCSVIPKEVVDSSPYKSCYRSRLIPLRKYDSELCGFVVILNNAETSTVSEGSVRVVLERERQYNNSVLVDSGLAECVLKPMIGDLSGRIYIGYTSVNYRSASFIVSGKCAGFAAYFTNSSNVDPNYVVPVTVRV